MALGAPQKIAVFTLPLLGLGLIFGLVLMNQPEDVDETELVMMDLSATPATYTKSDSCIDCHQDYHTSWHASFHRTMTQSATPEAVVAPFDGTTLRSEDEVFQLERKGDEFFAARIETVDGEEQKLEARKIKLTTGSHLMQTYWVETDNELRQLPWFFHLEEQMWIPAKDSFLNPPDTKPLSARWNDSCIRCHTTGAVPGFDERHGFNSTVAELGISCEACHGPGSRHVTFHRELADKYPEAIELARLVNPSTENHVAASQICGQCHSSYKSKDSKDWLRNGSPYRPGQDHTIGHRHVEFASKNPADADYIRDGFWGEGTCRVGGDEYLGLRDSKCFQNGKMSCLSCHSMHDSDPTDQLRRFDAADDSCLQCHSDFKDRIEEHTHHRPDSSGSRCYNCHMPHTSYALFKAIRSHRVDSPQTGNSTRNARPNACNLCHLDRSLKWTADRLTEWYEQPVIEFDDEDSQTAASLKWLLEGDAAQRVIVAWAMGWKPALEASGDNWEAPFLATTLQDPYSAVRFVAWQSLKSLPGYADFEFDFTADETTRDQSRKEALLQWTPIGDAQPANRFDRLLLLPQGKINEEAVRRLIENQNNRRVEILE